jgi:uncharacterized protein YcbX
MRVFKIAVHPISSSAGIKRKQATTASRGGTALRALRTISGQKDRACALGAMRDRQFSLARFPP